MKRQGTKQQITIRLEPDVLAAAKKMAQATSIPVATIVADAAREALVIERASNEDRNTKLNHQILKRLDVLQHACLQDLAMLRELLGLFARGYFNSTPPVDIDNRDAFAHHGAKRFARLVGLLDEHVRQGSSVFDDQTREVSS